MYTGVITIIPLHFEIRRPCGVAAAGCCIVTSAITKVYITSNVRATKHGLVTKIPDKVNVLVYKLCRYKQHLKLRQPTNCYFNHLILTVMVSYR